MPQTFDPTTNRFSYRPRGDAERFEPHFPRLKEALKDRFAGQMRFEENTVIWNSDKKCAVVTFPVDHTPLLMEGVSNFIFGAFEILGF